MDVSIQIESNFLERPNATVNGKVEKIEGKHFISWIQLPQKDEAFGSKYKLQFDPEVGVLDLERTGDCVTRMRFRKGTRSRGELTTQEGQFELEIYTHQLQVFAEPGVAYLSYDLIFGGQEPMHNELKINIVPVEAQKRE